MGKWEQSNITQEVIEKRGPIKHTKILAATKGNGYQNALVMPYLSELKNYIDRVKKDSSLMQKPVVLLAPDCYVARQAYLVLCRMLSIMEDQMWEGDDLFSYGEIDLSGIAEDESDIDIASDEILVVLKEHYHPDKADLSVAMTFMMGSPDTEELFNHFINQAKYLLLEPEVMTDPDSTLEEVMELQNEHIGLFLKPTGSYQYVVKRLVFEKNYEVITLQKPSQNEYIAYAKDFIHSNGFCLEQEKICGELIDKLRSYRGALFTEQDIYTHLSRVFERMGRQNRIALERVDFDLDYVFKKKSAQERLEEMIGLKNVKEMILRKMAIQKVLCQTETEFYSHMMFEGPPGVGKSETARILADYMGENGLANGRFVDAARANIIGKYVGHTADNIKKIFERAEGGVLFIDEASFLLSEDAFAKEAVVELVRYMELYPQTTVILATYPEEAQQVIELDPGLSSRFKQVLTFSGYSNEELYRIMTGMAQKNGFSLSAGCMAPMETYINQMRNRKNFGNAREVRKLFEIAVEEYSIRIGGGRKKELIAEDFEKASKWLTRKPGAVKQPMGFQVTREVLKCS